MCVVFAEMHGESERKSQSA